MSSGYFAPSRGVRWFLQPTAELPQSDFSGGLNLRDAPTELGDTDTPDCMNITLDERGGIGKRLGRVRKNANALPGVPTNIFFWKSAGVTIFQIGSTVYKTVDDFATWSALATFTTAARAAFCDFNNELVAVHKTDGVYTYDGTTWTLRTAAVRGTCIASWQNKVWVGGDPRPGNASVVWWCNAGDAHTWTVATDFNALREKDDSPVTAIGLGQGMDVAGRPGLLVFKEDSAYRINDSATGAYTTIDGAAGCAGPLAVITILGVTAVINKLGIFTTDPNSVNQLTLVSAKINRYFRSDALNFGEQDKWCAGAYNDRIIFSLPWGPAQPTNNRSLEFHPLLGWIVPHDFGASAFTTYSKDDDRLYAASPDGDYVYQQFVSGSDDGAPIAARYQTRWLSGGVGAEASFRRLRLFGRGVFDVYTKIDFEGGDGTLEGTVDLAGGAAVWDIDEWDVPEWGPANYEDHTDLAGFGFGKNISFLFRETSATSASTPSLLEDGPQEEVGAFAVYALRLDYVVRGLS